MGYGIDLQKERKSNSDECDSFTFSILYFIKKISLDVIEFKDYNINATKCIFLHNRR